MEKRAEYYREQMIEDRRIIHQFAELGMDLPQTTAYVLERLRDMGYQPKRVGTSGISALVGPNRGKTILLRADMDALPLAEETGLSFASKRGNMHACGHDLHTASLLGAAQLLKEAEDTLEGQVKLMFQPGEEIMEGAQDMLDHGILHDPAVDRAVAIHVSPGLATGRVGTCKGVSMASNDTFRIAIQGRGGHGSTPQDTIDPIAIGVQIHLALQQLISRETNYQKGAAITVGRFQAGSAPNIIPDVAVMEGTLRSLHPTTRSYLKERIVTLSEQVGEAYRGQVRVDYEVSVPPVVNDPDFTQQVMDVIGGMDGLTYSTISPSSGSEDFSLLSELVPSTLLMLGAKDPDNKTSYPAHHPKVVFDEEAIVKGAALYATIARDWLKKQ